MVRSHHAPDTLPRAPHWTDRAACAGLPTAIFFPVSSDGVPAQVEAEYAKSFCAVCPVRATCLAHALAHREDHGVWGGLTEEERAVLVRTARLAAERQRRREREQQRAQAIA